MVVKRRIPMPGILRHAGSMNELSYAVRSHYDKAALLLIRYTLVLYMAPETVITAH